MVKSSRSHYVCHCVALHYDVDADDDDTGYDGYEDGYVALASDDGDGSDNDNLLNPHISDLFFSIFHDAFPADTVHLIKLIKHLEPLCSFLFFLINNVTLVCNFNNELIIIYCLRSRFSIKKFGTHVDIYLFY